MPSQVSAATLHNMKQTWASNAQHLGQLQKLELKAKKWVQEGPGAAKCSLSMALQVAPLCWRTLTRSPDTHEEESRTGSLTPLSSECLSAESY